MLAQWPGCTCGARLLEIEYVERGLWIGDHAGARLPIGNVSAAGMCRNVPIPPIASTYRLAARNLTNLRRAKDVERPIMTTPSLG
jgi:hypothetical protein